MYYLCSENKGADQLRGYREADLHLCFRIYKQWFSHEAAKSVVSPPAQLEIFSEFALNLQVPGHHSYFRKFPNCSFPGITHISERFPAAVMSCKESFFNKVTE